MDGEKCVVYICEEGRVRLGHNLIHAHYDCEMTSSGENNSRGLLHTEVLTCSE
jgi:hypothetical protein